MDDLQSSAKTALNQRFANERSPGNRDFFGIYSSLILIVRKLLGTSSDSPMGVTNDQSIENF
jgi:hypothetical protein